MKFKVKFSLQINAMKYTKIDSFCFYFHQNVFGKNKKIIKRRIVVNVIICNKDQNKDEIEYLAFLFSQILLKITKIKMI